ncbi:hypothetical protein IW261DRAFT_1419816 [Armillaria novae-zelandiae]|uniref:Uncharacterized protein n=1 Tax=Armillaria novae-zelandiae TaxID=153914 RepID=A0AA39P8W0_9AGAR|nr:hypothetical protein IW261DRAFT_1419816 [Armillaria novae-zelandiae]
MTVRKPHVAMSSDQMLVHPRFFHLNAHLLIISNGRKKGGMLFYYLTVLLNRSVQETDRPPIITTADAPFHDPTDSVDLIIRTADNVASSSLVVCYCCILHRRSSATFYKATVEELSTTFRVILLLCYPNDQPGSIKTTEDVSVIGDALERYCMDYTIERFERIMSTSALIRDQVLQLFVLGIRKGERNLGKAAAKNTLFVPLNKEESEGRTFDYIREVLQKLCETPRPEITLNEKVISRAVMSSRVQCQIDHWKDIAESEIQVFAKLLSEEIDRRSSEATLDVK